MSDYLATPSQLRSWLRRLAVERQVLFPQPHGKASYRFAPLSPEAGDDILTFDGYRPTTIPPFRQLLPPREELLHFGLGEAGGTETSAVLDREPRVLMGIRPCDLKGIHYMDRVFQEGHADPYYMSRRINTTLVAYQCGKVCDDRAFCASVGSLDHEEGADLLLLPLPSGDVLVHEVTPKGGELLTEADGFSPTKDGAAKRVGAVAARPEPFGRSFDVPSAEIKNVVEKHWQSPVWDRHVERCFSCGTCNLVCPTCYCFDVQDHLELDAVTGKRTRSWDACMLPEFAMVAGGHNFRPEPAGRQRHRVKRKFEYLPERFKLGSACVGCGRCGRQCTADIDIFDIVTDLVRSGS